MATYTKRFGNSFTANQLRYVKNKYGKDPEYGYASLLRKPSLMCLKPWSEVKLTKNNRTMLVNNPQMRKGNKKRKRSDSQERFVICLVFESPSQGIISFLMRVCSNPPGKPKPSPGKEESPTLDEEKEDAEAKPATLSTTPVLPTSPTPCVAPAPPAADSFDFDLPVLQGDGPALPHAPNFLGHGEQEPQTGRRFSPVRSPRYPFRSPPRYGYSNSQAPVGWGGFANQLPPRPTTSLYAGTEFEGNYAMGPTVQGNYQPAQPRQMPPIPPLNQGQFSGIRYPLPDYSHHSQPYNDHHAMGFMPNGMGGIHAPTFSGQGYGHTDPLLQQSSLEMHHVHDTHNAYAQGTHWHRAEVPGYYENAQQAHHQMRPVHETLPSNSASLTHRSKAQPHQDPSASLPSQSAPPVLPAPLPALGDPVSTDDSLLVSTRKTTESHPPFTHDPLLTGPLSSFTFSPKAPLHQSPNRMMRTPLLSEILDPRIMETTPRQTNDRIFSSSNEQSSLNFITTPKMANLLNAEDS